MRRPARILFTLPAEGWYTWPRMSLLSARELSKAYGARVLFSNATLTVREGERVGLLGTNGTGKSTLLRILAGVEPPDTGVLELRRDATVLYLSQEPELPEESTARAVVTSGLRAWEAAKRAYEEASARIEGGSAGDGAIARQAELAEAVEHLGGWERDHVVEEMCAALGIVDLDRPVSTLSGGERRRVALARLLVAAPDLAILDEPTNHLDADTIAWLEDYLVHTFAGSVVLVTHDRYVLDAVCDRIFELDLGELTEFEGNYTRYLERKAEMLAHEDRVEQNRQNVLRREKAWLARGAQARSTKQKARIQRAEELIAKNPRERAANVRLDGLDGNVARLGKSILDLEGVGISIGGKTLIRRLELHLVAGDRIGVVGRNGTGKTTLLRLITGELAPDRGAVVRGKNTRIALFDQGRTALEDDWCVYDNVAGHEGALQTGGGMVDLGADRRVDLRVYLETFLFDGHKQRQKVGALSGGERARVALAKVLREGQNLLLLDEPTNDLDIATLGALEELLEQWPGCAVVVSHDRAFLDNVATMILAFEGGGEVVAYAGNFSTYRTLKAEGEAARSAEEKARSRTSPGKPPVKSEGAAARTPPRKALTHAERIELDGLLSRIESAEGAAARLEEELADPELYTRRAAEAPSVQRRHEEAKAAVSRLTARWEELEARREPGR